MDGKIPPDVWDDASSRTSRWKIGRWRTSVCDVQEDDPRAHEDPRQEYVPGTITSIELEDSDAPLLLSSGAQKTLGLVIDMGKHTAYSRTLDRELELLDYNGLPAVRLHPGEVRPGSIAMTTTVDEVMTDTNDATEYVIVSDDEETVEEQRREEKRREETIEKAEVRHMPAVEGSVKVLNRKQKKHLQENLEDMEKEDCALWSTLSKENKRPSRMLPKGCKTFLMELFAGAATLSYMAVHMGFAISAPIDIIYDSRYDLLQKANRDKID